MCHEGKINIEFNENILFFLGLEKINRIEFCENWRRCWVFSSRNREALLRSFISIIKINFILKIKFFSRKKYAHNCTWASTQIYSCSAACIREETSTLLFYMFFLYLTLKKNHIQVEWRAMHLRRCRAINEVLFFSSSILFHLAII